jgi:protease PrsW
MIYLIGTPAQPRRTGRGLLLVLSAVVVHGVWDSAAALGGDTVLTPLILLVITVLAVAALFVALHLGAARERGFMRAIMAPEVRAGTITDAELDGLAGDRGERRAALRRRGRGTSRRRERHILDAARDLAADLAVSGGEDSADVVHSRAEIARLRG